LTVVSRKNGEITMGDYTRLKLDLVLKSTTTPNVVAILKDIADRREISESRWPDHKLFRLEHWRSTLSSTGGAAYFPEATGGVLLSRLEDGRLSDQALSNAGE
jgi:hypothetical protein